MCCVFLLDSTVQNPFFFLASQSQRHSHNSYVIKSELIAISQSYFTKRAVGTRIDNKKTELKNICSSFALLRKKRGSQNTKANFNAVFIYITMSKQKSEKQFKLKQNRQSKKKTGSKKMNIVQSLLYYR